MKKISAVFMTLCMVVIIYFFIKEQFRSIVLSHTENMILSITYLILGISILMFVRMNVMEKKKQGN